jgi:hypothetical protein
VYLSLTGDRGHGRNAGEESTSSMPQQVRRSWSEVGEPLALSLGIKTGRFSPTEALESALVSVNSKGTYSSGVSMKLEAFTT